MQCGGQFFVAMSAEDDEVPHPPLLAPPSVPPFSSRLSLDPSQENELKIRESFQLLTQGVEMVHYEVARTGMKSCSKIKKILWLVEFLFLSSFFTLE
jgi:hypothetical protein